MSNSGQKKELGDKRPESSCYVCRSGYRYVYPYLDSLCSNTKRRWIGRKVSEVFKKEFPFYAPGYIDKAISYGRITVDGKSITSDTVFVDGNKVKHTLHRHEPPVRGDDVCVVKETSKAIVVNKPSSIPVHSCGRFRKNSILEILKREKGYGDLFTVHRLDRMTSGLLIIAKEKAEARRLADILNTRTDVVKEYLARVKGRFPEKASVDQPVFTSHKLTGYFEVGPEGKPAQTEFELLDYHEPSGTSLVRCLPKTGRTHQIRVHLKHLGHPIANDILYLYPRDENGKPVERPAKRQRTEIVDSDFFPAAEPPLPSGFPDDIAYDKVELCEFCEGKPVLIGDGLEEEGMPDLDGDMIYLHALKYTFDGVSFEVPQPAWATPAKMN